MNTSLPYHEFGTEIASAFQSAQNIPSFGLSNVQYERLSKISGPDLKSLLSVAQAEGHINLKTYVEIKSPDTEDFTKTKEILAWVGGTLVAYCGVIVAILGIAAAVMFLVPPAAAVLGIIAGFFALLAVGITALMFFLGWLLLPELHSGIEFGGKGGSPFQDNLDVKGKGGMFSKYPQSTIDNWEIDRVELWVGNVVDAIRTCWRGRDGYLVEGGERPKFNGQKWGGSGGQLKTFQLQPGESIIGIKVKAGVRVDSITFLTNQRVSEAFGGRGGDREATLRGDVVGFMGKRGDVIDAIGILQSTHSHQLVGFGGDGGIPFAVDLSKMVRLVRMNVWHGNYIDAIQLILEIDNNQIVEAPIYGGYFPGGVGGTPDGIDFAPGETLDAVQLRTGLYVDQLVVHTSSKRSQAFGRSGGDLRPRIDLVGKRPLAMVGRYSRFVDKLGFIFE